MIRGVLIDLSGTIHIENEVVPGAVEALEKLRKTNLFLKFVTNTTKESRDFLYNRLTKLGFKLKHEEIFSSLLAAKKVIVEKQLNPMLMLAPEAMEDFNDIKVQSDKKVDAVVVGLAPTEFHYDRLNTAFRHLLQGAELIGIHAGRYYKRSDGLALGPGMFVRGLEYAANCQATIVGKPNKNFFLSAIDDLKPEECIMIGDDAGDDVRGAIEAGMQGILVKTGKYRPGDEEKLKDKDFDMLPDFATAVEKILQKINDK